MGIRGIIRSHPLKQSYSCSFQVRVYDLSKYEHGADDVLILATDGLWDVLSNEEVAEAITQFLPNCDPDDPHRFVHFLIVSVFCDVIEINNNQGIPPPHSWFLVYLRGMDGLVTKLQKLLCYLT